MLSIEELKLSSDSVIAGIGNPHKGDDKAGCYVADRLIEHGLSRVVNCETVPENYLEKISSMRPDIVLLVDAAKSGKAARTVGIYRAHEISAGVTTHTAGLDMAMDYIEMSCGAAVFFAGIASKKSDGDMGPEVRKACDMLVEKIRRRLCMSR